MQRMFYEQAARQLIDEVRTRFKVGISFNNKPKPLKNLFLLDGLRIDSLLDVPDDTVILIISSDEELQGVSFEKVPFGIDKTSSDK